MKCVAYSRILWHNCFFSITWGRGSSVCLPPLGKHTEHLDKEASMSLYAHHYRGEYWS